MTRPSTAERDKRMLALYETGKPPKAIAQRFRVTVWVVYMAVRRIRRIVDVKMRDLAHG